MEAKKNKMCKVRLRRLRPDMADKLKPKRAITKNDIQYSSSSSETEDDEMNVDEEFEKISVKLKSPLTLGCNKDFDPYMLLTEAQAALKLCSDEKSNASLREGNRERLQSEDNVTKTEANVAKTNKKPKHCKKQKSQYYPSLENCSGDGSGSKLRSSIENDIYDLIYYHSDEERSCNNSCNHGRFPSSTSALGPIVRRSCSTGSSSSPLSEKCSMRFSKLFENNCISVMDDENPPTALSKILSIKEFDPLAPQQILAIIIKSIVSLAELSQRDDNIVCIDIDKRRILEFSAMSPEEKRNCPLNPYMDVSNIIVTHSDDEFLTFCLCEKCEKYREFVIHIMVEQFKATHMVVMLLDVLIKSYGPMLKNITAYNKFEKLLDSNKEIYWITCGVIYHKKAEHLDFIYDEYLSDNMIFVLFSSILMLNNPLLLLQVLAFHIECIVKAYAEGFLEIVEPDKSKIPADEMINYILNGYDDLMRISEQVASYLFAFENDFLRKFSLTWKLLCQRLYQQHVHLHLADTMLACIITLKEEELTSHHTDLIKRYIQFDDVMNFVEKRWTDVWIELNKFNLSEVERKRRSSLLDVYRIFDTVVQDAIGFSLQDSVDDNDFYDFRFLKNRRLAWKNIMSYTKMKWPDGFFQPPNTLVVDDKCATCNVSLDYHADFCKCITCSIAGGPLPPKKNADGKCSKCLAHELVEKDVNFYDSKIMNVCANDDFQNLVSKSVIGEKGIINTALHDVGQELCSTIASVEELINDNDYDKCSEQMIANDSRYHISWAVFNHLNSRKRYPHTTIDENYFCTDCKLPSCLLARKILNNKISPSLSQDLIHYYQPLSMTRDELYSILPNIMMYNRKLVASNNGLDLIDVHDLVVKIYWIFIISIYATYFIDYNDEDCDGDDKVKNLENPNELRNKSLILNALELSNNDIIVNAEKIIGNKDDTKFLEFLDKVKSLSPFNNDVESNFEVGVSSSNSEMQKKLNEILNIQNNHDIPPPCDNVPPPIIPSTEEQLEDSELNLSNAVEDQPKKSCKEKFKKCCLDHCEMDDHYKESHSSKKRLKKDCNHARMNETRDRLRKKLSQIVNARKNSNTVPTPPVPQTSTTLASNNSESNNPMDYVPNAEVFPSYLQQQKPPTWDEVHEIVYAFERFHNEAKRNENLQNLCECLQHLQTNSKGETKTCNNIGNKKVQHNHQKKMEHHQQLLNDNQPPTQNVQSLEPPNKRLNFSDNSVTESAISNQTTKIKDNKPTTIANPSTKSGNDLNFVSEICEIIDSYSKEQTKRSSNENLHNLCECLQQLQTNPKSDSKTQSNKSIKNVHQNNYQNQQKVQEQHPTDSNQYPANQSCSSLEPPNKKSNLSNTSTRDASTSSQGAKSKDNNSINTNTTTPTPITSSKTTNNLDFVSEICEIIDNYSKEQAKRRWIKETLSFIEGPTAGTGKKKSQPQTLNPKKAAKKAKQKQRKEEEKRIAELHDLRAQFHNIYFKEFSEKINLKSQKANKKRDKKKIAEIESNIKNLQRAKAKVETAILELIATVKQTNSEFKFSYLPTKEQQLEKLRELESHDAVGKNTDKTIKVRNLLHHTAKDSNSVTPTMSSPFTMTPTNNLNMVPESYSMPYAHANHFPYNLGFPPPVAPAPFGLMRATPMCYAPPPATALAAAEEQRSLAPDVVAAMASNVATNNTTDPSKRIVTIRRVNLPNVPEPQVTVTAKGSSPDKDKLLYTFINGQLIQTGTAPPINIPQMSAINNQTNNQPSTLNSETSSRTHASKLAVENLLTIPPPPPPKLSKTQMKKERKRLAKLQAESSEIAETNRIEKDQKEFLEEQKQPKKKKNTMVTDQRAKVSCYQSSKEVLNSKNKNKNKNKLCNSNSTTSVSTNENNESPQLPQMLALKNSAKQKRSDSTTTSCSAVTTPSSNNSTSSQMNTRDNSLSSLKPVDSKTSKNKRSGNVNEPKCNNTLSKVNTANKNKTKTVQQKHNKKQNRISVTPSTTSSETEHDDEEEEVSGNKENKLTSASMTQTKKVQLSQTTKLSAINKQKTQSQKTKPIKKPVTPSTSDTESEEEIVQKINHKKRRPKLVDNGQFDNNPFKSLHMQDSETNWSSEEEVENEEESENEIECKRKSALEEKIVIQQKSDHKDKQQADQSKTAKLNQKSKKNKTQNLATTPITENANITSKTSKNNKNTNYQQQNNSSDHPKVNNVKNQNRSHDGENRGNSQTRLQRQNCNSNVRNSKAEIGSQIKTNNKQQRNSSKAHPQIPANSNVNNANSSSSTNNKSQTRNNTRQHSNNNNRNTNCAQKIATEQTQNTFQHNNLQPYPSGNAENKNQPPKRSQRNKKYQQKSHKHSENMHHQSYSSSSSGIPNHMGYFNINEVNIEGAQAQQPSPINNSNNNLNQNSTYQSLAEQMQALRLSGGQQVQSNAATASAQQRQQHINTANVSIMDQLNRGVQVENLSLPPGITLTKVDPIKSEQLRQKSESIKKLAKPLQPPSQAFHHSSMAGPTIIAPPIVNSMASYYGSPYVTASAGIDPQSGIIMVEANPPKNSNVSNNKKVTPSTGTCNGKQSKNKKRRNKSKAKNLAAGTTTNSGNNDNSKQEINMGNGQPKMITLRNPMFHSGPTTAPTAMLQPQVILPGRPVVDGFPMPTPLSVDQPAAIIKNENGMYTIRNPALHQAVTSGLAMGGYRQFGGNVSYYTPQEAAAEAARATRQQQQQQQRHEDNKSSSSSLGNANSSSFSYFSNDVIQANMSHNNINISCTSIGGGEINTQNHACVNTVGGLSGDAAVIQRPTPQQRPISAIGSEIKSAQQQKQKTKAEQQQWTNFGSDTLPLNKNDNLNTSFLGAVADSASAAVAGSGDMNLQEKYQQSKYYNGFEVFTGSSGGSSSSAATCAHIHHNCGDDSPPPSITGYNSYLEGIPNTGVIRYDDASFLKNLIPGQNLNNEVSIHNVNESNFTRNAQSPTAHHVEITPVYGNRPSSASLYESSAGQTNKANYRGNYRDPLNDYNCVDAAMFSNSNMNMNLNDLDTSMKYDFESTASTSGGTVGCDTSHNTILDFNDLLIQNGPTGKVSSHCSSPYLDETTMDGFVQNINSLKISNTSSEEPSSHLGSSNSNCARHGTPSTTSANPSNGWW